MLTEWKCKLQEIVVENKLLIRNNEEHIVLFQTYKEAIIDACVIDWQRRWSSRGSAAPKWREKWAHAGLKTLSHKTTRGQSRHIKHHNNIRDKGNEMRSCLWLVQLKCLFIRRMKKWLTDRKRASKGCCSWMNVDSYSSFKSPRIFF